MKYSSKERLGIRDVFIAARKELLKPHSKYICYAIKDTICSSYDIMNAGDVIKSRMGTENDGLSLEVWLWHRGFRTGVTRENMLQYRLRWLDSLIEEFSH